MLSIVLVGLLFVAVLAVGMVGPANLQLAIAAVVLALIVFALLLALSLGDGLWSGCVALFVLELVPTALAGVGWHRSLPRGIGSDISKVVPGESPAPVYRFAFFGGVALMSIAFVAAPLFFILSLAMGLN